MRRVLRWSTILGIACAAVPATSQTLPPASAAPARAMVSPEEELRASYRESFEAFQRGAFAESERAARRALTLAESLYGPQHAITLDAAFSLSAALQRQRRWTEAEPLLIRSIAGFERLGGDATDALFRAFNNLGLLYTRQARYREAEPLVRRALELSRALPGQSQATAALSGRLADILQAQGRYLEAEPILLSLASDSGPNAAPRQILLSLCEGYRAMGRYADAERLCRQAIATFGEDVGQDAEDLVSAIRLLGSVLTFQGRFTEAEQLLRRAAEQAERVSGAESLLYAYASASLGFHFQFRDRHQDAELFNARALPLFVRHLGPRAINTYGVTLNLAETYGSLGRHSEATAMLRGALEGLATLPSSHPPLEFEIVNELGDVSRVQGRWAEAEQYYWRAFEGRRQVLGASHPETIESAIGISLSRLQSGGPASSAVESARAAIQGMRRRRSLSELASQRSYTVRDFSILADAIWQDEGTRRRDANAGNEAFLALQDAIAGSTDRALTQMAIRRVADAQQPGLGALVRERDALAEQIAANDRAYGESFVSSDVEAANMRARLAEARTQLTASLDRVDAALRAQFPDYFSLVRPEAVDASAIRNLLTDDQAVLLIVPGRFGTHVVALSRSSMQWHRSGWTEVQVGQAVATLQRDIARTMRNQGYRYDRATAHALYRELIQPVAATLGNSRHVFTVTGGALTSLPLGILVVDPPTGADSDPAALRSTRWLSDVYALSQLPSVQSLRILRQPRRSGSPPAAGGPGFLGFGDPVLAEPPAGGPLADGTGPITLTTLFSTPRDASGAGLADVSQLRQLSRLPGTATELENMRSALGAPAESLYLGPRATERLVRTTDLTGARILALATHGLVAGEIQGLAEPGLVFTPPDVSSADDDGYLTASEVSSLRLNADWVILSACNTAAGDGSTGAPGLSGLARAFFYAGARNLLASHWLVSDAAAPRLTVRTLELMRQNPSLSRAQALQRSMREVRQDPAHAAWAHPGVWGAFSLIGDGAN